ncbi:MAG: hypothetical protein IJZ78_00205 [Alistipes sp.]|nr:hypothetical protein [Alistipes sp.]
MKKQVLSILLLLVSSFAVGQEPTKEQQRMALINMVVNQQAKIAQDPAAAAKAVRAATDNELVNTDAYVWYVSILAKKTVIDNENRKRAEGVEFDEALIYSYVYELGVDLENCEKYDNLPDANGQVMPKYKDFILRTYAQQFAQFYNAGAYYYNNEEYEKAYDLFKMFIDTSDKLYKEDLIYKDTINVPITAYYMALCGMQLKNYDMVLTYIDLAMEHPEITNDAFRFKTEAVKQKGDINAWLALVKEGIEKYTDDIYFSQSLIYYYDRNNMMEELDMLADNLIALVPSYPLYVYLKGYIAGRKEEYDIAIKWYIKTLEVDPNYVNALSNLASCYIITARKYNGEGTAEDNNFVESCYRSAIPHLEKLRQIAPNEHNLWFDNLISCYYNLKMADKVSELEKLQESLGY